jgi:TDG/mug DNA glycosylase family protein
VPDSNDLIGLQAVAPWRGVDVLTLADVPPDEGRVVLIGINPSPVSVAAGHYYQGTLGKRLWARLEAIGLLGDAGSPWEDERWRAAGNGLTDVVKRPTPSAKDVTDDEMALGGELLRAKLTTWRPGLILFPFLASAEAVIGEKPSPGPGPAIDGIPTFRLAGPYASSAEVDDNGRQLSELLGLRGVAAVEEVPSRREPAPAAALAQVANTEQAVSQPVTAADNAAGRIRFPRRAKGFFPTTRSTVTVVLRGIKVEGRYDPRMGPDRERSAVLNVGRQALTGIPVSERLRVSVRPTDGLVALDLQDEKEA